MWQVQMEFIPGNPTIWVAHLKAGDPIYEYDNEIECTNKAAELQSQDSTGRQYKAVQIS